MGLRAKTRRKLQRLQKKRAEKATIKAQYKAFAEAGILKNSRRQRLRAKNKTRLVKNFKHLNKCGNIGCDLCSQKIS